MLAIEKLVSLILKVLAFLVIVIIIFLLAKTIYDGFSGYFKKEEILKKYQPNYESLLRNIEDCHKIDDFNCICEIFPNFPASFPEEIKINITTINNKSNVTLIYKQKDVIDWREIESIFRGYGIVLIENKKNLEEFGKEEITVEFNKKDIYGYPGFKTSLPSFYTIYKEDIYFILISPYILKVTKNRKNISYFLGISSKKIAGYTGTGLPIINSIELNDLNKVKEDLDKKIENIPKCIDGRYRSVEFFKKLNETITNKKNIENLEVNLDEKFLIEIDEKNMRLLYYKNGVKEIVSILKEENIEGTLAYVSFDHDISCKGKKLELMNGDKINIINGCIEKL